MECKERRGENIKKDCRDLQIICVLQEHEGLDYGVCSGWEAWKERPDPDCGGPCAPASVLGIYPGNPPQASIRRKTWPGFHLR